MKLVGELKKNVEKTDTKEEAKRLIKEAGMEISDDELNEVSGGSWAFSPGPSGPLPSIPKPSSPGSSVPEAPYPSVKKK